MKVSEYFESVENLKDRLMQRDAVTINGDVYMIDHQGAKDKCYYGSADGDRGNIDLNGFGDWEYDEESYGFVRPNGDLLIFFDLEIYEP